MFCISGLTMEKYRKTPTAISSSTISFDLEEVLSWNLQEICKIDNYQKYQKIGPLGAFLQCEKLNLPELMLIYLTPPGIGLIAQKKVKIWKKNWAPIFFGQKYHSKGVDKISYFFPKVHKSTILMHEWPSLIIVKNDFRWTDREL